MPKGFYANPYSHKFQQEHCMANSTATKFDFLKKYLKKRLSEFQLVRIVNTTANNNDD